MSHDEQLETEHTLLDQEAQAVNMSSSRCRLLVPAAVDALAYTIDVSDAVPGAVLAAKPAVGRIQA